MNIGIDAAPLRFRLAGVGWYLWELVQEFLALSENDLFFLYASRPLCVSHPGARFRYRTAHDGLLVPGSFWMQLHARNFARRDHLDCFWAASHHLPMSLPDNVRTAFSVHDLVSIYYPEHMGRLNAIVHHLYFRKSVERADVILAVSLRTKTDLIRELGVPEAKVHVVHAGVASGFQPIPMVEVAERIQRLGIPDKYLLSVGTIEPRKNYPLLFQVIAGLPDLHLVIAGRKGWKYGKILSQIAELGLDRRVHLLEYVSTPDLVALYNAAQLVVLPSVYEGFGLPVLEAMACGTPVLASNTSSLPEVGGDAAAYFESNSVESLRAELVRLLADPVARAAMSARGLARAKEFTWQRAARTALALIEGRG